MVSASERGSEVVQFALVAPLLLFALFGIVQVGGMMLAASQVSSDITRACRQMDLAGLRLASDKEAFVKAGILGASTQLIPENLQVERVRLESAQTRVTRLLGEGDSAEQRTATARLSYDVRYEVPSILDVPGLSGRTFSRHVDCSYVEGRVIEVEVREGL